MTNPKGPALASIAQAVAAQLTQPISLDEFTARILERYPSRAKDPRQRMREYLRWDGANDGILMLDTKTVAPARIALKGARFRVPLDESEIAQGVVFAEPGFTPFIKPSSQYGWMAVTGEFVDANDQPIPSRVISLPTNMLNFINHKPIEIDHPAFELRAWLSQHHAQVRDTLLVTLLNLDTPRFRLEFEPQSHRRASEIEKQNHAFADLVWTMLQDTVDEQLITSMAIPTAFAQFLTARREAYPGDHWLAALNADQRVRVTDWMIVTSDHRFPFDLMFEQPGEHAIAEQPFTEEQAARVYRFRATANYNRQKRIVDILGSQTLGEFDDAMRTAFRLDHSDHLSEFTRIIRRGKSKKPHKQPYGEINPFEETTAMQVHVAGLRLEIGAELQYVYDFGDWLEHTLILEQINEPKPGANRR